MPSQEIRQQQLRRGEIKARIRDEAAPHLERIKAIDELFEGRPLTVRYSALKARIWRLVEKGQKFGVPDAPHTDVNRSGNSDLRDRLPYHNLNHQQSEELERLMARAGFPVPPRPLPAVKQHDPELDALIAQARSMANADQPAALVPALVPTEVAGNGDLGGNVVERAPVA